MFPFYPMFPNDIREGSVVHYIFAGLLFPLIMMGVFGALVGIAMLGFALFYLVQEPLFWILAPIWAVGTWAVVKYKWL